jgi:Calcineurin-like phosphoesterase
VRVIAEVLDRRFLLSVLEQLRSDLTGAGARRSVRGEEPVENAEALIDLMGDAIERQRTAENEGVARLLEAQPGLRDAAEQGEPVLEEHVAYLPRDPFESTTQSALEQYFEEVEPDVIDDSREPEASPVTVKRLKFPQPPGPIRTELFERFSLMDPRWLESKLSRWFTKWNGKHGFRDTDRPRVTHLDPKARIILVGDWASGLKRAGDVANFMRQAVVASMSAKQEVHVIHLGDTYYSGRRREYRDNFLPHWPVRNNEDAMVGSWTLSGNHDMYSGGDGYYELLEDPRFARQDRFSFFHLQNEYWDLLGLDTAYTDHDLTGRELQWIERVVGESRLAGRKTLLLSHHQPFSGRNEGGTELRRTLGKVLLSDSPIDAWFWGHEHRHAEYKEAYGVRNGRLIGHGGVPKWMGRSDRDGYIWPERWEYREVKPEHMLPGGPLIPWALFGFAILDFKGDEIAVTYQNELGSVYRTETIK